MDHFFVVVFAFCNVCFLQPCGHLFGNTQSTTIEFSLVHYHDCHRKPISEINLSNMKLYNDGSKITCDAKTIRNQILQHGCLSLFC